MSETEVLTLLDGEQVGTGLLLPTEKDLKDALRFNVYADDQFLEASDIEKSLKNDKYKTFRRLRSKRIINQGSIGKCNASAIVAAFHNRRELDGMTDVVLADSHLYMNINGGSDRGSQLVHGMEYSTLNGVAPVLLDVNGEQQKFPLAAFNRRQVSQALLRAADIAAKTYQTFEAYRVPVTDYNTFKIAIASAIARDHQIVIALHAGRSFMSLNKGYIQQSRGPGNHALIVHSGKWVGGDDLVHPDIQNSWGPTKNPLLGRVGGSGWGEDGFGLITMSSLWQCARSHVFWVFPGSKANKGAL
jgi:hypothetical protein